ncbi:MAG: carbohydrate-binding protein, partial [Calditrichales bacterium]
RYVNEETIIGYDLLNEPVLAPGYTNVALRSLYVRIISAIRTLDKNHMVFIEGNWYATDFSSLTPPMDTNLVYSFHKYWSETTKSTIQQYINIRNEFNVPLWLGESGENSNPWFYETIKLMEENEIGWNWWTHKKISTTTSPYSSPISDNYQRVLDYLGGYGDRPSEEFSQKALFEMAENLALEKCIYLPDVVAAIFSQDFNFQSQPYKPHPIPGMIAAVDYDKGNQSVAYYDTDYKRTRWDAWEPWNTGGAYRNDGVDIGEIAAEKGGGFYVGWIENGEWLQYTIDVAVDGVYDLVFAVASAGDAGKIRAKMDGVASGTDLSVPNTSDWQNWTQIRLPGIALTKGTHHFRIEFIGGGFNLSQIAFNLRSAENLDEIGKEGFMGQNFPNPFNNKTSIPVVLNSRTNVRAEVYNTRGQLVRTLFDADHDAGLLTLSWDGENNTGLPVTSGSYFYMLRIGESKKSKKMLYLK